MKSKFKRVMTIAVLAFMTLSILTACGEDTTLIPFLDKNSGKANFEDYEFNLMQTVRTDNSGGVISNENVFGYEVTTTPNDAALKRISDIESLLNCDINIETTNYEADILVSRSLSNNLKYEAVYSTSNYLTVDFARSKILLPVEQYGDYIDFTNPEKYGGVNVAEVNSFKGSVYGVSPVSWVFKQPRSVGLTVFNMGLVESYGKTNPREFLEKGEWTWETFEHIIDDYYIHEGDKEIYSLATRSFDFNRLAALSNGVKYADISADGTALQDYYSGKLTEAFDWYADLARNYADHFAISMTSETMDWPDVEESFCEKQNSMACITAPNVLFYDIIYEVPKYAVLPFPSGPQGVYGDWAAIIEAAESFSVFMAAQQPEFAFQIIDMLCEPLEGFETEDSVISYLGSSVLYSIEDAEIVYSLKNNGQYTYWPHGEWSIGDFYGDHCVRCLTSTVSELLGQERDRFKSYLEEFVKPNLAIYDLYE